MEGNLGDNDHELEGNERTKKMDFKKYMHQQTQTTGWKEHIDRKSIAKLEAGSF